MRSGTGAAVGDELVVVRFICGGGVDYGSGGGSCGGDFCR